MKCPLCEGEFEPIKLESHSGTPAKANRCDNCGGIWISRMSEGGFDTDSVLKYDTPSASYSLRSYSLVCPLDESLMNSSDFEAMPTGGKYFQCMECGGLFYPKGQLALFAKWQDDVRKTNQYFALSRGRTMLGVAVMLVGVIASVGAYVKSGTVLKANEINTISDAAPNIFTLILLGLTYIAGTLLAVLGRKRLLVYLGWAIIAICLFGFSLIVFGP